MEDLDYELFTNYESWIMKFESVLEPFYIVFLFFPTSII